MSQLFEREQDEGVVAGDVEVGLDENVYSFFQFIVPSEKKKENKGLTIDIINAYFLVMLCIFMQLLALYAIFYSVVVKDVKWQDKVMTLGGKSWGLFAEKQECNDGNSLCTIENGIFTCAPPSVQLTGRWEDLDVDDDGIWSIEEAEAEQERLQCKFGVDPVEVFDIFTKIVLTREDVLWIDPDLRSGKRIRKPYFEFLKGDVIMCGYGSIDMCPNLLQRGFFNAPLELGTSPRVGNTTETALEYCKGLLEQAGTCETYLPSTYATWQKESVEQCGDPDYDRIVFEHPVTKKQKSMLTVDYDERKSYAMFQTPLFILYKYMILFVWGLVMMSELQTVTRLWQWVFFFASEPAVNKEDVQTIEGIDRCHRVMNGIIGAIRSFVLVMLMWIGTLFLLKSGDYVDLLFDAVAVVFILEFGEILYSKAIRKPLQTQCGEMNSMKFKGKVFSPFLANRPGLVDLLWIVGLFIVVAVVMTRYYSTSVIPVYHALECTCLNEGDKCREADVFNYDFWYDYWANVVPKVFEDVDAIKAETAGAIQTILHTRVSHHHNHHHRHHALIGSA